MKARSGTLLAATLPAVIPLAVRANHSASVNFDMNADVDVTGIIKRTKCVNPHSQISLEVTTADGSNESLLIEMNALNAIRRFQ